MTPETFGRTIQLFLVDGTPTGLRKATIHGWTGLTFVATGTTFAALTARPELDRTGIYILSGPDAEAVGGTRAYIGSANSVRERIKQSAAQREFWETAIAVTTSDDDLSKGHVEYLEARLIQMATEANRVTLDNGTSPAGQRRRLPEADQANMEQFLANLKIILPVVGLDLLKPQPRAVTQTATPVAQRISGEISFEIRHKSGVQAQAVEEDGEFIVLEGSQALKDTGYVQQSYVGLKDNLVKQGVLIVQSETLYVFARPYSFSMYPINAGEKLNARFLLYWLISDDFAQFSALYEGRTVLPKINQKALNATPFPLPPLSEQAEIVRRIESAFGWIDRMAADHAAAARLVPKLDAAILAKAFQGKLVPQDPNDEPAAKLLERIKAEREDAPKKGRGRQKGIVVESHIGPMRAEVVRPTSKAKGSSMTKSRQDDEVKDKPYLAGLLKSGRFSDAQSLFRAADLPVSDFYKQLAWEIDKGHILDNAEELKAA